MKNNDFEDELVEEKEERYVLTEECCMMMALEDFGIHVNIYVAKAIKDRFLDLMVKQGHAQKVED